MRRNRNLRAFILLQGGVFAMATATAACGSSTPHEGDPLGASSDAAALLTKVQARFVFNAPSVEGPASLVASGVSNSRALLKAAAASGFRMRGGKLVAEFANENAGASPTHRTDVRLGMHANQPFELHSEDAKIRVTLDGATNAQAEEAGGYVTYRNALDGADVIHRVTADGTEDYAVFAEAPVKAELTYKVAIDAGIAGLRLVGNTLEMLDEHGTPKLRVAAPYGMDAERRLFDAQLAVTGCAVDTSPQAPWGRTVTAPGASECMVHVTWGNVSYPAIIDPTWTSTSALAQSVSWAASQSVQLTSGRILVAEGTANTGSHIYDYTTDTWAVTGALDSLNRISGSLVALAGGKALLAAGVIGLNDYRNASSSTTRVYDEAAGTWSASGNTVVAHGNRTSIIALSDGKILLVGGENLSQPFAVKDTESWDPATGIWTARANLNVIRREPIMGLLPNGKVIAVSGSDNPGCANAATGQSAEIFDPAANTWVTIAPNSTNHHHGWGLVLPNGRFLVGGNVCGPAIAETYDPVANTWGPSTSIVSGYSEGGRVNALLAHSRVIYSIAGAARALSLDAAGNPSGDTADGTLPLAPGIAINGLHRLPDGRLFYLAVSYVNAGDHRGGTTAIRGCNSHFATPGQPVGSACATAAAPVCDATATCVAPLANGQLVPPNPNGAAPYNGVCTQAVGAVVCASGVCSAADNQCGLPNGAVAVDSAGNPINSIGVCRSNFINADGKCGEVNSDPTVPRNNACVDPNPAPAVSAQCRSNVCFAQAGVVNAADNQCGLPNGEACGSSVACRTLCVAADATCGALNGAACTNAATCRTGVCHTDSACGLPNGQVCVTPTVCRSGICSAATCGSKCAADADCGAAFWCEKTAGVCQADAKNGSKPVATSGPVGCDRGAQCVTASCGADGFCGIVDATACSADPRQCRSGICTAGKCGNNCTTDVDCAAGTYCEDSKKQCTAAEPNGSQTGPAGAKNVDCTQARGVAQCVSGVCNADGKCGAPDGSACSAPTTCRGEACVDDICSSGCSPQGAGGDVQCAAGFFCSLPGKPLPSPGMCLAAFANGTKPQGVSCTRPSQCASNICHADGLCGTPDGQSCAAATQCRTGACLDGLCGGKSGCTSDSQCNVADYCKNPGNAGACTPKQPNDTACTAADVCVSAVCNKDGKCGNPKGDTCGTNVICRTGLCDLSVLKCVGCATDTQCGTAVSGKVCDVASGGTCIDGCRGSGGNTCATPQKCTSSSNTIGACVECTADLDCGSTTSARICEKNKCQDGCRGSGGNGCAAPKTCSSTTSTAGTCSVNGCTKDADCTSLQFCNTAIKPGACTDKKANSQPCSSTTQCVSAVCDADGKCGSQDGAKCTSRDTCRSAACTNGVCGVGTNRQPGAINGSLEGGGIGCSTGTGSSSNGIALLGFAALAVSLIGRRRRDSSIR